MGIRRAIVENYKGLRRTDVSFGKTVNLIVGDNEVGKSTLLEAINLALRRQVNRRTVDQELHPYLMNQEAVAEFIDRHKSGETVPPPRILIEIYLDDDPDVADLIGANNSLKENTPGISFALQLDEKNFSDEYKDFVANQEELTTIPIEYYEVVWKSFSGETLTYRSIPLRSVLIDAAASGPGLAPQRQLLDVIKDYLSKDEAAKLALAYRTLKQQFQSDERINAINSGLTAKKEVLSDRTLSIAMDTTTRSSWEVAVAPYLDSIPLSLAGKGEQNTIKIKLAVEASTNSNVVLIEEPENHLSHTNLGKLVSHLSQRCASKQIILTTHSSFVMNKLGNESVIMFDGKKGLPLKDLPKETQSFFRRLPGHDTLRMVLARKSILVEGPSDELLVQKAYLQAHNKHPLELGHEVISVGTSFKRFLEIAIRLGLEVDVITDNDGDPTGKKNLYQEYASASKVRVFIDDDEKARTLEPQLVKANGLQKMNEVLGTAFQDTKALEDYMSTRKTDVALRIYDYAGKISIPSYIADAVKK